MRFFFSVCRESTACGTKISKLKTIQIFSNFVNILYVYANCLIIISALIQGPLQQCFWLMLHNYCIIFIPTWCIFYLSCTHVTVQCTVHSVHAHQIILSLLYKGSSLPLIQPLCIECYKNRPLFTQAGIHIVRFLRFVITINSPLILKVRDIIFLCGKNIMGFYIWR